MKTPKQIWIAIRKDDGTLVIADFTRRDVIEALEQRLSGWRRYYVVKKYIPTKKARSK